MADDYVCQHCGAPWQPTVIGSCPFCRVAAPPSGARSTNKGGTPPGPAIDTDALYRLLRKSVGQERPLDALSADLRTVAGDRLTATGSPVERLEVILDDWRYQAWIEHDNLASQAVHTVRGVDLKRQSLPFDEWLACLAAHLGELAAANRRMFEAIVALDRPV